MTYRAYLNDPQVPHIPKIPVFPRSRKTVVFKTIQTASRRLEQTTRSHKHDTRGLIYDTDGNLVHTIAL